MSACPIGFCGLGLMGLSMTRRLIEAGHSVRVWNRSHEKARVLAEESSADAKAVPRCVACRTPAEVAGATEMVMLCLANADAVEAVVFGADGLATGARDGATLIDHSTLSPSQTIALAQRWHARTGGRWIDAPVSGGTAGAAAGTLAVMAGGSADAFDAATPVIAAYAARVTRMGDSGAGQATKLANQTIVMTTIAALAEATRLAQHAGIDVTRIPAALQGGWADSVLLQTLMPRMIEPPVRASGTIRTMLKDLDAVEALAHDSRVSLPVASLVRLWLARAVEQGLGDEDISQIVRVPLEA